MEDQLQDHDDGAEQNDAASSETTTFGQYGQHFQRKVLQCLLTDPTWAEQMVEVLDPAYFELKFLQYLAERYVAYARKYKAYPTLKLLVTLVRDELRAASDIALRDQVIEYIRGLKTNPDMGDLPMVKEKAIEFCRRQSLKRALEKTVDLIETEKYESIVELIKKAVSAGTSSSVGHDFFEDAEARFMAVERNAVPTGIPQLDSKEVLQGGAGRGELNVVIAATGVGKSHFLTVIGANAIRNKLNVLHYTFELSEAKIGIRYDSNLCDVDSNEVVERKDEVLGRYKDMDLGKLIIKYYPTNTATVQTLRTHMEKLSLRGFVPDVLIIDYADIMRSTRQYDSLRHELKLLYEELRAFAAEYNVVLWTASQSNKDGATAEIVDVGNMSEAYSKAFTADLVISLSRRASEKANGQGRLYVAKNRNGIDGLVFPINIDTARSKITVTGEQTTPGLAAEMDQVDIRQRLRDHFSKYQSLDIKKVS